MSAYVQTNSKNRAISFAVIGLFHVFMIWALANGLGQKIIKIIVPPLQTDIVEEIKKDDKPPPPPPPEIERPQVELPPPVVSIDIPVDAPVTTALTDVTTRPTPPPAAPAPRETVRKAPKSDPNRNPPTDDYYPPSAKRLGVEGVTTVKACIGPDGKVTGDPSLVKGSGNDSIDEAALKYARKTRWIPGTEDGKPAQFCIPFAVRFKLTE